MPEVGEDSIIRKARKKMVDSKVLEAIVRYAVITALAGGAGLASHSVTDAKETTVHAENGAELARLEQDLREFKAGMLQRVEVEENEREADAQKLRDRILYLEYVTGARHEPPAAAAPRPRP